VISPFETALRLIIVSKITVFTLN